MAHWAEIDNDNKVIRVLVGDNNDPDEGYQWLINNLDGTWIKTSYNGNIRKQYAGIGFYFDAINNVFISPQPFTSWTLDENFDWQAPTPMPADEKSYAWDEKTLAWLEVGQE